MFIFGNNFPTVCLGMNIASNSFFAVKYLLRMVYFPNSWSIDIFVDKNNNLQFKKKEVESERIEVIFILNVQKNRFVGFQSNPKLFVIYTLQHAHLR